MRVESSLGTVQYSTVQRTVQYSTGYLVYCVLEVTRNCGTLTHPYCSPTPVTTAATPLVTCVTRHVSRVTSDECVT